MDTFSTFATDSNVPLQPDRTPRHPRRRKPASARRAFGADNVEPARPLPNNPHACGVDDETALVPDPVPYAGHSNRALLAHFW